MLTRPRWFFLLAAFVSGCDSPLMDPGEEITLSAAIDEAGEPLDIRDRFSLEDERIHVHLAIPPETAGPERRDFLFEFVDGSGSVVSSRGAVVVRERADWLVRSTHRIDPEIDVVGPWSINIYVDGRHLESRRFAVTETPGSPLPEAGAFAGTTDRCCASPGSPTLQVFLGANIDEESGMLIERRESFRLSDSKMQLYLRLRHLPDGPHELQYDFYDGAGRPRQRFEYPFESTRRGWNAWVAHAFDRASDAPGLWTVDIFLDGQLTGSVRVPVEQ